MKDEIHLTYEANTLKIIQPTYKCKKHFETELWLEIPNLGKKLCGVCYHELLINNCEVLEEIKPTDTPV